MLYNFKLPLVYDVQRDICRVYNVHCMYVIRIKCVVYLSVYEIGRVI